MERRQREAELRRLKAQNQEWIKDFRPEGAAEFGSMPSFRWVQMLLPVACMLLLTWSKAWTCIDTVNLTALIPGPTARLTRRKLEPELQADEQVGWRAGREGRRRWFALSTWVCLTFTFHFHFLEHLGLSHFHFLFLTFTFLGLVCLTFSLSIFTFLSWVVGMTVCLSV